MASTRPLLRPSTVASALPIAGIDGMRAQIALVVCHLLIVVCMQVHVGPASIASCCRLLRVAQCADQR
jgi:hypothetical protein